MAAFEKSEAQGDAGSSAGRAERKPIDKEKVERLIECFSRFPMLDERTEDAILGYDDNGLPS